MSVSVVLMGVGWDLTTQFEGPTTGQRVYWDAAAVPHKSPTTLPELGEPWEAGSLALAQRITKTPLGDDPSVGFAYTVTYSDESSAVDWMGQDDSNIVIGIQSGAEYDSYTLDPNAGDQLWAYDPGTASYIALDKAMVLGKMSPVQTITITKRSRSSNIVSLLSTDAELVGCINDDSWNGFAIGTVLYMGMTASPVKEQDDFDAKTKVAWNVTYTYRVRLLPGVASDSWQYVFVAGGYVRLSKDGATEDGFTAYDKYKYASIPNPLA